MVRNKEADIGLFVGVTEAHSLVTFPFGGDRLILAVPQTHSLAKHDRIRFQEFVGEDFVTLGHGTAVRKVLLEQAGPQFLPRSDHEPWAPRCHQRRFIQRLRRLGRGSTHISRYRL
jgi:DNA-binding transcriptional LysR family regulator